MQGKRSWRSGYPATNALWPEHMFPSSVLFKVLPFPIQWHFFSSLDHNWCIIFSTKYNMLLQEYHLLESVGVYCAKLFFKKKLNLKANFKLQKWLSVCSLKCMSSDLKRQSEQTNEISSSSWCSSSGKFHIKADLERERRGFVGSSAARMQTMAFFKRKKKHHHQVSVRSSLGWQAMLPLLALPKGNWAISHTWVFITMPRTGFFQTWRSPTKNRTSLFRPSAFCSVATINSVNLDDQCLWCYCHPHYHNRFHIFQSCPPLPHYHHHDHRPAPTPHFSITPWLTCLPSPAPLSSILTNHFPWPISDWRTCHLTHESSLCETQLDFSLGQQPESTTHNVHYSF